MAAPVVAAFAKGINGASDTTVATGATLAVSAGDLLIALVTSQEAGTGGQTVTGITDGTNTFTACTASTAGGGGYAQVWYKENAAAVGSATFTATWSAAVRFKAITVLRVTGAATSAALLAQSTGAGGGSTSVTSGNLTTSRPALLVGVATSTNDRTWTPTSATEAYDALQTDGSGSHGSFYVGQEAASTYTLTNVASTSSNLDLAAAAFGAIPGPAITTQPTNQRVSVGQTATFTAAATGAVSQRWQTNASGAWVDIPGATSTSYTTAALVAGTAYAVRIIFTDGTTESTSNPADTWTPAVQSRAGLVTRRGTDLLRSRLLVGSSRAALGVGESALLGVAAGGASAPAGLASEADTALALGRSAPAGLAAEADAALASAAVAIRATGLATEADQALALAPTQVRAAGIASQVDTALALTPPAGAAAGLATGSDAALALAGQQQRSAGLTTEADASLPLVGVQQRAASAGLEADAALALAGTQVRPAGVASESDTALAAAGLQIQPAGLSTEADSALALSSTAGQAAGLANETDAALALAAVQTLPAGMAAETDAALALTPGATTSAGLASEADAALALSGVQQLQTGLASDTSAAFGLAGVNIGAAGLAQTSELALALLNGLAGTGLAVETDTALALQPGITIQPVASEGGGGRTRRHRIQEPARDEITDDELMHIAAAIVISGVLEWDHSQAA